MDVEQKVAELRRQQKEQRKSCEEIQHLLQELDRQRQGVTAQVQECSDVSGRQIKALTVDVEQKAAELRRQQDEHRVSLATLQMYVGTFPPIKLTANVMESEWGWCSFPFHSHPQGYKMCLKVCPHGYGIGVGTHVSVFVQLMKGDFDDCLRWPFQGSVVLQLCNQLEDKYHYGDTIDFSVPTDHRIVNRVTNGEFAETEWAIHTFIAHEYLNFNPAIYCQYLMDNLLVFRILAVELLSEPGVLPTELTMTNFEQHKTNNDCWSSPRFYTHPKGYKMGLEVYASRSCNDRKTYISVYVNLMRGEFDSCLKWPFHGDVTVAMLNQLEDKNHAIETIRFSDATEYAGHRDFIAHTQLNYQPAKNHQYLKYDCLRFRIVKVELW